MVPKPCVVTIHGSRYQTRSQKFTSLFNKAENSFLHPNSSSLLSWCPLQKYVWALHFCDLFIFLVSSIEKIIYILTLIWIQRKSNLQFCFYVNLKGFGCVNYVLLFCAKIVFQWPLSSFVFGFLRDFRGRTRVEKEHLEHMAH